MINLLTLFAGIATSLAVGCFTFKILFREIDDFVLGVDTLFRSMAEQNRNTLKVWVWAILSLSAGVVAYLEVRQYVGNP